MTDHITVPKEPTEEMCIDGSDAFAKWSDGPEEAIANAYKAMIAAAPEHVCEWSRMGYKDNVFVWIPACRKMFTMMDRAQGDYCTYCGGKIKEISDED